jgi:serine phosphatase RsbU (regulator of sigma subunit)
MGKVKALFLSANPDDAARLHLDEEMREITARVRAAEHRDELDIVSAWAVRPDDLLQCLMEHQPHIVHFSGHGNQAEEILMLGDDHHARPVSKEALLTVFETLTDNIRIVLLNSCFSRAQAAAIVNVIDCAIGMNGAIGDQAAITFAAAFYQAIGFNRSVGDAFETGRAALMLNGISEEDTPELLVKDGISADGMFLVVNSPGAPTTTDVTLMIQMSLADFDDRTRKFLRHAVAEFLEIDHEAVSIVAEEEGSVKVTLRLPYEAGERLRTAHTASDPELVRRLAATAETYGNKSLKRESQPIPSSFRVLVLDESNPSEIAALVERLPNATATAEASLTRAISFLSDEHFAAVILNLTDSSDSRTLKEMERFASNVPMLVMTERSDAASLKLAFQMGAFWLVEKSELSEQRLEMFIRSAARLGAYRSVSMELEQAQEVQQRMLPNHATSVPGFDIAGRCIPAAATGGDYFDFIALPDESLGVVIADVSGHGLGASLLMAQTRGVLRSELRRNLDAGDAVNEVNRSLIADTAAHQFVALHLSRLNPRDRSLIYIGAGHTGYVLDENGNVKQELASTGMPLGVAADPPAEVGPLVLKPGDVLLLFTDGITESIASDARFGVERVLANVRSNVDQPASLIVDGLFDEVKNFRGQDPQLDDMTAIVVRVEDDKEAQGS